MQFNCIEITLRLAECRATWYERAMVIDEAFSWSEFAPSERAVIVFIRSGASILLIDKKRGLGAGKVNGPGGRIEPGETSVQAAIRETHEEVGLFVTDLDHRVVLQFAFVDGYMLEVDVYFTSSYSGSLVETDEARPFWCLEASIPYAKMWADDRLWLPRALAGERIAGRFVFDGDTMLTHELRNTDTHPS